MAFRSVITVLAVSLLTALVSVPLVMRKVSRNRFYGIRTRRDGTARRREEEV